MTLDTIAADLFNRIPLTHNIDYATTDNTNTSRRTPNGDGTDPRSAMNVITKDRPTCIHDDRTIPKANYSLYLMIKDTCTKNNSTRVDHVRGTATGLESGLLISVGTSDRTAEDRTTPEHLINSPRMSSIGPNRDGVGSLTL